MDDSLLHLEIENLRELLRLKNLNKQLLDANYTLLTKLIEKHEKDGSPIEANIQTLLADVKRVLFEINPINRQLTGKNTNHEDNSTRYTVLLAYRHLFFLLTFGT